MMGLMPRDEEPVLILSAIGWNTDEDLAKEPTVLAP